MIEAVIFDFGGVLVRTPGRESRRKWEEKLGLDEWGSEVMVFGSEMGMSAQNGEITDQELWDWVGHHLSLSSEQLEEFRSDFWYGDILDISLIDYIRSLRPRYQTAIISNAHRKAGFLMNDGLFQGVPTWDSSATLTFHPPRRQHSRL